MAKGEAKEYEGPACATMGECTQLAKEQKKADDEVLDKMGIADPRKGASFYQDMSASHLFDRMQEMQDKCSCYDQEALDAAARESEFKDSLVKEDPRAAAFHGDSTGPVLNGAMRMFMR